MALQPSRNAPARQKTDKLEFLKNIIKFELELNRSYFLKPLEQPKKIITDKYEITLIEKGIVETYMLPNSIIDAADILEMKGYNLQLCENKPYVMLLTSGHLSDTTKEARELSASKDFSQLTMARALLTDSIGHKLVANFYLKVNTPHVKTKLFSDREKALTWLRSFIK